MADNPTIEHVVAQREEELMRKPNVNGVGIGERRGKRVIKVFVTGKVPQSELSPDEVIPSAIDGYDVDVEAIGELAAQN